MLKNILGYIFIFSILLFYIYYGIILIDNFDNKTEIIIYIISYILLGITIFNMLLISKYWEVLSEKVGPPGPRGLMGVEGDEGSKGSCSLDHNVMFALIQIKSAIAEAITGLNDKNEMADIYNESENTLKNSTLDILINRIVQSKEFDTILLRPETDEKVKYGKSLKDIIGYLKSIIVEWCVNIYKLPGGPEFFNRVDGSFSDTKEIEEYFHNEIEKYDIWYWGGTRVFKPLEIMVMRQTEYRDNKNKIQQNSAFPMDDKPRLEFIEVEYSDMDTSNLIFLWTSFGIGTSKKKVNDDFEDITEEFKSKAERRAARAERKSAKAERKANKKAEKLKKKYGKEYQQYEPTQDWSNWSNNKIGLYGNYIQPAIYLPKVKVINNKKFYPLGCVMIETDNENKSSFKKKTLLVSGDVIIPKKFDLMWYNRRRINIIKNNGQPHDGANAALFWKLSTTNPNYVVLGDIPQSKKDGDKYKRKSFLDNPYTSLELLKLLLNTNNSSNYKGIVAIPKDLVKEIPSQDYPEWSYKLSSNGNFNNTNNQIDIFTGNGDQSNHFNIIRFKNKRYNMITQDVGNKLYTINKKANKHRNNPLKLTEPENNDLGFGYYGYPYLITDKYSIFKFLNLVPEGIIINYNNNRKLYIRHYGGADMNRYNIFKYNTKTGRYDKALRLNGSTNVDFSRMKPNDPRFGFSYEIDNNDSRFIRFKSISNPNGGYLAYISQITNTKYDTERNNRPAGISIDHTKSTFILEEGKGEISNKNKKLFMFLQAHGRGLTDVNQPRLDLANMKHPGSKNTYT
jgi:hypothetical protein